MSARNPLQIRNVLKFYCSKPLVGPKFNSLDEIKNYVLKDTLSANDYLAESESQKDRQLPTPSVKTVLKLLKLTGLSSEGKDIGAIQRTLGKQLSFIDILQNTRLDEEVDPAFARLMPRDNKPLSYEDLLHKVARNRGKEKATEETRSWDSTSRAALQKEHYFVFNEEFLDNRD